MATTKLTVIVPEELHRQARAVAALKGENISTVVREALAEYVTSAMQPAAEEQSAPAKILDEIEPEFARQVADFIERYRPALQALAK